MNRMLLCFLAAAAAVIAQGASAEDLGARDLSLQQQMVVAVQSPHPGALKTTAWVDHPTNIYKIGDKVRLFVRANEDAYFAVISVGPSGNAVRLYPNAVQPDTQVKAGQILEITGKNATTSIVAGGTPGTELIRVVAATAPVTFISDDELAGNGAFRNITGGAKTVARDLQLVQTPATVELAYYDKKIRTVASGQVATTPPVVVSTELSAPQPTASERPPVLLSVDRHTYKIGDTVTMAVTTQEPCYLWVVDVAADGKAIVLFPNKIVRDNYIQAPGTTLLSGANSSVQIRAAAPTGTDAVFALCGRDPTSPWLGGVDFSVMFSAVDTSRGLAKALVVAAPNPGTAQIPSQYTWASTEVTVE